MSSRRRSRQFLQLMEEASNCRICEHRLPLGPRPVFHMHPAARILVVGQAPGTAVHRTGIPFNDPSGERLRAWMGIDKSVFYDEKRIAIVPMGFCYPGTTNAGDLPPRPECAATWRHRFMATLKDVELTIALGRYAVDWHLKPDRRATLTDVVRSWRASWPSVVPLPHPSPRNTQWLKNNPWVEREIVPALQRRVQALTSNGR